MIEREKELWDDIGDLVTKYNDLPRNKIRWESNTILDLLEHLFIFVSDGDPHAAE